MDLTNMSALDVLLSVAAEVSNKDAASDEIIPKPKLVNCNNEDEVFLETIADFAKSGTSQVLPQNDEITRKTAKPKGTSYQNDYMDSSDEEADRNTESAKYNDCGKSIKHLLTTSETTKTFTHFESQSWKSKQHQTKKNELCVAAPKKIDKNTQNDVQSDPIFGMRISKPLISSAMLTDKMQGRDAVAMSRLKFYVTRSSFDKDWVVAGAIVHKSAPKTSQTGTQFMIWQLSDLKDDIKTVSVFLFGNAYKQLWKTNQATIVGILNPNILEKKGNSKDEATLSVTNPDRVMILGSSKDFGTCKSVKKNGEKCTSIVNISKCEFCVFHIKQEYAKCSKRSELQSNFQGNGLTALRNKVLGKNEVFYGGKSYLAINPAKKSSKLIEKDKNRLSNLQKGAPPPPPKVPDISKRGGTFKKKSAAVLQFSQAQRVKDLERLRKLGVNKELDIGNEVTEFSADESKLVSVEDSRTAALGVISKLKKTAVEHANNSALNVLSVLKIDENLSPSVSLEESKSVALSAIAKLKARNSSNSNAATNKSTSSVDGTGKPKTAKENVQNSPETGLSKSSLKTPERASTKLNGTAFNKSTSSVDGANKTKSAKENVRKSPEAAVSKSTLKTPERANSNNYSTAINKSTSSVNGTDKTKTAVENVRKSPPEAALSTNSATPERAKQSTPSQINKLFSPSHVPTLRAPVLGNSSKSSNCLIEFDMPAPRRSMNRAKQVALSYVRKNGPLAKSDPMRVRSAPKKTGHKRILEQLNADTGADSESARKKTKIDENEFFSERFKKMMAATSTHAHLLEQKDNEEQDKYFDKLEMKERLEEKMMTTYKVECKAVRCVWCKYTSFSASPKCKQEKHPLKVFDAFKRFFKCGGCGHRTVTLDVIPMHSCKNCGSGKWERTTMMKEKVVSNNTTLSIRGGEEKFVNSVATDANINLMVCRKFDQMGQKLLNRGFYQVERRHAAVLRKFRSMLPRRESERRIHQLARHCDILTAIETRISMLNMTFSKYIEWKVSCFIPGKVLDEIERVLTVVETSCEPPRTHELLQELRDISSMAMEHFDEHIIPIVRKKRDVTMSNLSIPMVIPTHSLQKTYVGMVRIEQTFRKELNCVANRSHSHKHQLQSLKKHVNKLTSKIKRQRIRLVLQSSRMREQEIKIAEQKVKTQEQENTLAELKRHMEEWHQKFADLTTELSRSRIIATSPPPPPPSIIKRTSSMSPQRPAVSPFKPLCTFATTVGVSPPKIYKPNIKPRVAQVFHRCGGGGRIPPAALDLERKRKLVVSYTEMPPPVNKAPKQTAVTGSVHENGAKGSEKGADGGCTEVDSAAGGAGAHKQAAPPPPGGKTLGEFLDFTIESLIKAPISSIKARKRKYVSSIM